MAVCCYLCGKWEVELLKMNSIGEETDKLLLAFSQSLFTSENPTFCKEELKSGSVCIRCVLLLQDVKSKLDAMEKASEDFYSIRKTLEDQLVKAQSNAFISDSAHLDPMATRQFETLIMNTEHYKFREKVLTKLQDNFFQIAGVGNEVADENNINHPQRSISSTPTVKAEPLEFGNGESDMELQEEFSPDSTDTQLESNDEPPMSPMSNGSNSRFPFPAVSPSSSTRSVQSSTSRSINSTFENCIFAPPLFAPLFPPPQQTSPPSIGKQTLNTSPSRRTPRAFRPIAVSHTGVRLPLPRLATVTGRKPINIDRKGSIGQTEEKEGINSTLVRPSKITNSVQSHTKEKPLALEKCFYCSQFVPYINAHQRENHGDYPIWHSHITNTDEENCPMDEMNIYRSEMIKCQIKTCDKKFNGKHEFLRHLKSDHGFNAVVHCASCSSFFRTTTFLNAHRKKDHPEEETIFKCRYCSQEFLTNLANVNHFRKIHSKKMIW